MRTIGRDFGDTARKVYAVASGALGNGKTCVVNSNGTVSVVALDSASQALGTEGVFNAATTTEISSVYDSNAGRVVMAYKDEGNSSRGTAIVGTVDAANNTISFGSEVVFETGTTDFTSMTFDSNSNRVVIAYRDDADSDHGKAVVGTVSGTSISFGSIVTWRSAAVEFIATTFDSNSNKVVIVYKDNGDANKGKAFVGTVDPSDNSISFGSAEQFDSSIEYVSVDFDSSNNKVVVLYKDNDNSQYPTVIVGTVSNTSISFGTAVVIQSNSHGGDSSAVAYDSTAQKVGLFYNAQSEGKAAVGTVSGTSITVNVRSYAFESGGAIRITAVYDENSNKIVVAYRDPQDSNKGKIALPRISGTDMIDPDGTMPSSGGAGSPIIFETGAVTRHIGLAFDSANKKVTIAYTDEGNSEHGTFRVLQNSFSNTNLTSENYIGITPSAYPTGAGAEIQTKGAVNEEQSGLTAGQSYFVQTDGTLGTTAGDPSVFAGTAVSATKIIVKG